MGNSQFVDKCSGWHTLGTATGVGLSTAIGGAIGAEVGEANALDSALTRANAAFPRGIERVETSHWISSFKNTALDGEWNWKEMWGSDHALNDPIRYRFMRRWWKPDNPINNPLVRQWNRMPTWAQASAVGATYGSASALAGRSCGCH